MFWNKHKGGWGILRKLIVHVYDVHGSFGEERGEEDEAEEDEQREL